MWISRDKLLDYQVPNFSMKRYTAIHTTSSSSILFKFLKKKK
ncbi:hypothetical protein JCM19298_2908 [Nonlabens ulvanivorans]|nr:hypothetical protein JCM19297_2696 [Nonlabens ulvanivorans]GAK92420.1 hypothetical protein JCM19298_2908 [Nonlabens ulvanivorans]